VSRWWADALAVLRARPTRLSLKGSWIAPHPPPPTHPQPPTLTPRRQIILGDHPEWADHVRVGISTNFNKLCGMEMCQVRAFQLGRWL